MAALTHFRVIIYVRLGGCSLREREAAQLHREEKGSEEKGMKEKRPRCLSNLIGYIREKEREYRVERERVHFNERFRRLPVL